MMKQLFILFSAFIVIVLGACESLKKSQNTSHPEQNTSICGKTVRYIIEKLRMIEGANEVKVHTEITFNPTTKIINLKADDPEKGKISFDIEIESIDCSLTNDLTEGQAIYKGYIKQEDGRKTFSNLLIENKDGRLFITPSDGQNSSPYVMIVDGWEIVSN